MPKFRDITDQKFNRLTAIKRVGVIHWKYNRPTWLFRCDCGNYIECASSNVIQGLRKSCGCLKKENCSKNSKQRKNYGESCKNLVFKSIEAGAKKRDLEFNLTKDQVFLLIVQKCFYCNALPSNIKRSPWNSDILRYNGLDRVDNLKGYTIDNTVTCCFMCNKAKRNLTKEHFLNWVQAVYNYSIKNLNNPKNFDKNEIKTRPKINTPTEKIQDISVKTAILRQPALIKDYKFIILKDLSGKIYETDCLNFFCKEHNIPTQNMHKVLKGERKKAGGYSIERKIV